MDSSPDLSLKLRRGSSDSRDSFYMDFAQGIDSDIEEVDTTLNTRAPQQPPTPPPPPTSAPDVLPPPMMPLATQPLPTVSEAEDLPPTPPPTTRATTTAISSTTTTEADTVSNASLPLSPTTSVLEMMPPPPPPLSPTRRSPPIETEDEGDDDDEPLHQPETTASATNKDEADDVDDDDDEEEDDAEEDVTTDAATNGNATDAANDADDDADDDEDECDDDDEKTTPPPLAPLPSHLSYVHGSGAHGPALPTAPLTPPLTKSPSTSPSPPDTPPPCLRPKSLAKLMSPPPPPLAQPLTPPSESDQSQPNSPPPLPQQAAHMLYSPPQPGSPKSNSAGGSGNGIADVCPSTPPPEFGEADELVAAALAAAVEASAHELINGVPWEHGVPPPLPAGTAAEECRSQYDDESTTITTPPSNGYSGSSVMLPAGLVDHLGELEADARLILDDIPPPVEMQEIHEEELEEQSGSKTTIEEEEEQISEDTLDVEAECAEEAAAGGAATPSVSGSPKESGSFAATSRGASRSGSRSGSRNASRSGSIRASIASRAASIASTTTPGGIITLTSPPTSIKSLRSPSSTKSSLSKHSPPVAFKSPPATAMQSPPTADSPPTMPSPPLLVRSPPLLKSPPPGIHSPPTVASPPKLHSPQLVQHHPIPTSFKPSRASDSQSECTGTGTESLPSSGGSATTSAAAAQVAATATTTAAEGTAIKTSAATAATTTSLSYQDEHVAAPRPHLSSHHHYHLPHHFQHPHHQNHHTHGSVPVPTPTIPASFKLHSIGSDVLGAATAMGGNGGGGGPRRSPSPPVAAPATAAVATSTNVLLASADSASHASPSPAKSSARMRDSTSHHRVTIDESNLPHSSSSTQRHLSGDGGGGGGGSDGHDSDPSSPASSSHQQLAHLSGGDADDRQTGHLALMYHSHQLTSYPVLPAIKRTHRPSFVYPPMPRVRAGDALATLFSALYGKLLVVMGIAFPMAEVISTYIPPSFYEVFYLYLYIGSMIFLFFMYATLIWGRPKLPINITSPTKSSSKTRNSTSGSDSMDESDTDSNSTRNKHLPPVIPSARRPSLLAPLGRQHHYGSFYLRMGAVAFGIGSMIYSGLEFGQYFELNPDTKCHNVLLALTPATRMAFIFIQMYFIFLNNEQIKVYRYKIIARFGLMHMIGTNLAVWLNVLIQETKHEILTFYNPENRTLRISHRIPGHSRGHVIAVDPTAHLRVPRGLKGPYQIFECRRTNIIGTLVQDASPFLFPCTIEYSLICAAILYVMWRSISHPATMAKQRPDQPISPMKRSPHHYSVDCARAHKGLFVGILILVLTIISLILFFVLISRPDFVSLAVTEVTICELLIYATATIATLVGMIQIRHLEYDAYRNFSLDDILLVGAQTGSFLYNIFTVIAGHFTLRSDDMLVPINALASIVQTACQTMFILDASRRQANSPEHIRKKPGREIVTFMLVVNLAMWAISTLEKSRAESHPIQLNFYGLWAWTIITHVSMPLAIFYRFHSTVCLCEIWKRAYKLKPTYM